MRIVIGLDWNDQTFTAVQAVTRLYRPQEVVLVHAVDIRPFTDPIFGPSLSKQAYAEMRQFMEESGKQLVDRAADLLPAHVRSVRRLCEVGTPSHVIMDTARTASADLVALGARGLTRISEFFLGSVSHRVLLHAPCTTLIVKGKADIPKRVLMPVEGPEDGDRVKSWLHAHPFNHPVELSLLHVLPHPYVAEPGPSIPYGSWIQEVERRMEKMLQELAAALSGPHYNVTTTLAKGFTAATISKAAEGCDLVVVGSHGRTGVSRFFLGSVSHAVVHRVAAPVLVVRLS